MSDSKAIEYLNRLLDEHVGERFHGLKVTPFRMAGVPGRDDLGFFVARFIDEQNIDSRNHIAIDVPRARPDEEESEKFYAARLGSALRCAKELRVQNLRENKCTTAQEVYHRLQSGE